MLVRIIPYFRPENQVGHDIDELDRSSLLSRLASQRLLRSRKPRQCSAPSRGNDTPRRSIRFGGADNEFSLTLLFLCIPLFSSMFHVFPILSKVLRRVYWRTPTPTPFWFRLACDLRNYPLRMNTPYLRRSPCLDEGFSMKLYTFATIASKTLSRCPQTSSNRKRRTR